MMRWFVLFSLLGFSTAWADSREFSLYEMRQNSEIGKGLRSERRKDKSISRQESILGLLGPQSDLDYYLRLSGPAIGKRFEESYNVYSSSPWPISSYHSLEYAYHFDYDHTVALGASASQGLYHRMQDANGYVIQADWVFFHPSIQYRQRRVMETPSVDWDTSISLYLPTSEFSREQTQLASIAFDQSFSLKEFKSPWSAGLNFRFQPTFYENTKRDRSFTPRGLRRELVYFSFGHSLAYRWSDHFGLSSTSVFDWNKLSEKSGMDESSDDRYEVALTYYMTRSSKNRVGIFFQQPFFQSDKTYGIFGLDLNVGI